MNKLKTLIVKIAKVLSDTAQSDKRIKQKICDITIDNIVTRTKSGFGIKGKKKVKLKPLKKSTIERRKRAQLASDTSPSTSNLTESGKMLNSLECRITSTGFRITVNDDGKKVAGVSSDREFLGTTEADDDAIIKIIEDELVKQFNKLK